LIYSWLLRPGVCHTDLQTFLETNLPKSSKKEKVVLGVLDSKLAAAVAEASDTACMHTGVVPEIVRGKLMWHFYQCAMRIHTVVYVYVMRWHQ